MTKQYALSEIEEMPVFLIARRAPDESNIVQLDPGSFPNAFSVGIFLMDIARHYARAMSSTDPKLKFDDCVANIMEGALAEARNPTDMGSGDVVKVQ